MYQDYGFISVEIVYSKTPSKLASFIFCSRFEAISG
jgi:hypothetical protein